MQIKIEKNVPIPRIKSGAKGFYPWGKMEVGDSFFVDAIKPAVLQSSAWRYSRDAENGKWNFITRREGTGTRIWRVE